MTLPYTFTSQENQLLKKYSAKKTITSVFYHLWINTAQPESQFIFIDTVELVFGDNAKLFLKINDEDTGFNVLDHYDFEKEQQELAVQFNGVLYLKRVEVSVAPIWVKNIASPLVTLESQWDEKYTIGNFVTITFEAGAVEINYQQETGLGVVVYEEI
jgi:uncharacterized ubiquitin-like protein YukD